MPGGRKPRLDPPVGIEISLPSTLVAKMNLLLVDPIRGKRTHGALSQLITALLAKWIDDQIAASSSETSSADLQRDSE